jgi:cyclic nucleotide-binding protein
MSAQAARALDASRRDALHRDESERCGTVLNPTAKAVLSSLPGRLSERLFAEAKSCHLDAGEVLFAAGEAGNGCYRLERGLLKVVITSPQREERILAILGPGEIAGELSIIDGRPRSASVIAINDCDLTFMERAASGITSAQAARALDAGHHDALLIFPAPDDELRRPHSPLRNPHGELSIWNRRQSQYV